MAERKNRLRQRIERVTTRVILPFAVGTALLTGCAPPEQPDPTLPPNPPTDPTRAPERRPTMAPTLPPTDVPTAVSTIPIPIVQPTVEAPTRTPAPTAEPASPRPDLPLAGTDLDERIDDMGLGSYKDFYHTVLAAEDHFQIRHLDYLSNIYYFNDILKKVERQELKVGANSDDLAYMRGVWATPEIEQHAVGLAMARIEEFQYLQNPGAMSPEEMKKLLKTFAQTYPFLVLAAPDIMELNQWIPQGMNMSIAYKDRTIFTLPDGTSDASISTGYHEFVHQAELRKKLAPFISDKRYLHYLTRTIQIDMEILDTWLGMDPQIAADHNIFAYDFRPEQNTYDRDLLKYEGVIGATLGQPYFDRKKALLAGVAEPDKNKNKLTIVAYNNFLWEVGNKVRAIREKKLKGQGLTPEEEQFYNAREISEIMNSAFDMSHHAFIHGVYSDDSNWAGTPREADPHNPFVRFLDEYQKLRIETFSVLDPKVSYADHRAALQLPKTTAQIREHNETALSSQIEQYGAGYMGESRQGPIDYKVYSLPALPYFEDGPNLSGRSSFMLQINPVSLFNRPGDQPFAVLFSFNKIKGDETYAIQNWNWQETGDGKGVVSFDVMPGRNVSFNVETVNGVYTFTATGSDRTIEMDVIATTPSVTKPGELIETDAAQALRGDFQKRQLATGPAFVLPQPDNTAKIFPVPQYMKGKPTDPILVLPGNRRTSILVRQPGNIRPTTLVVEGTHDSTGFKSMGVMSFEEPKEWTFEMDSGETYRFKIRDDYRETARKFLSGNSSGAYRINTFAVSGTNGTLEIVYSVDIKVGDQTTTIGLIPIP